MDLKMESWVEHNCTERQFAEWVSENYDEESFEYDDYQTGFGCACEYSDDENAQVEGNQYEMSLTVPFDDPIDELDDFEKELRRRLEAECGLDRVRVYLCKYCHTWAIDSDGWGDPYDEDED